ncbi:MAG TPA: hypothetical protein VGE07_17890 [Herpetosiphonaceae bacterium]
MPDALANLLTSSQWLGAVATGLAYVLVVLGVFITFRVLAFPDLTIDGSFPLGAAIGGVLLLRWPGLGGWGPWLALPAAFAGGALAGALTATLAARLRINGLLASIIVALGLYSVTLRIQGLALESRAPTANLQLISLPATVATPAAAPLRAALNGVCLAPGACFNNAAADRLGGIVVFGLLALAAVFGLHWLLSTELGLALRATGDNPQMVRAQGVSDGRMRLIGVGLSNGLIAMAGAMIAPVQGFADVTLGRGLIIIGLASVILGEVVVPPRSLLLALAGAALGSLLYRLFITLALNNTRTVGLQESDLQLLTALIVVAALAIPRLRRLTLRRGG